MSVDWWYSLRKRVGMQLLLATVDCRRPLRLGLQFPVRALARPVLLRLAGLDPLQLDAEIQPPRGQLAQAAALVGANRLVLPLRRRSGKPCSWNTLCMVARVAWPET